MKFPTLLVIILVTCAIYTEANSRRNKRQTGKLQKRQAQTNADQMVQDILQWLQTVYAQNTRKVRQGALREYLPPANTEKPRPFQSGYPPSGLSPEPPFTLPGGVTPSEEGYQPEDNNGLLPPDQGSGAGENGYIKPEPQPGFTLPTTVSGGEPTTSYPGKQGYPEEQPTTHTALPGFPTVQPGYPTAEPGYPSSQPTEQPGVFPTHAEGVPEGPSVFTTKQPGYPTTLQPGQQETTPGQLPSEGTRPPYTSPPGTQPSYEGTTGYPGPGEPQSAPGYSTPQPIPEQSSTTIQTEGQPAVSTLLPVGPGSTLPPVEGTYETHTSKEPEKPEPTQEGSEHLGSGAETAAPVEHGTGLIPTGFTTSTSSSSSEGAETTLNPEVNTIPGTGKAETSVVDEEDLKHPPHIHAIDVQCSKEMMTINIEFNREFNGVIYSKGFYNNPECRYVQENSGQTKYSFTVKMDMCGTEFVNAFDTQNQSYLENVLVLQNEPGIQEVWDTVRSVRCLWEGNVKDTLSVAFSIGMLSQEIVTFSGDTAMAKLDVVLGRGPFGEPANGLVKIGEEMTLVVSVSGDPGFDLQVKDCKAVDAENKNSIILTDEDGCILKPKLFGAFQKTKETGNTGASIIAYAYFNAFKFPDEMDLMIECNIELCKTDCDMCSKENQQLEPAKRRRKRDLSYNTTLGDGLTMGKHLRIILPEDLNEKTALELTSRDHICMSIQSFIFSTATLVSLLVVSLFASICLWLKRGDRKYVKY